MAKAGPKGKAKNFSLNQQQKAELKRLTQLVNRRISAAQNAYEKVGKTIIPYEISGGIQTRAQWASEKYAVSRSTTQFKTKKAFQEHMKWLKSFEGANARAGIKEYTKIQRDKLMTAIETATGGDITVKLKKKIDKLGAAEMSIFWDKFSDKAAKMSLDFSSNASMSEVLVDYFQEDYNELVA